MSSTISPLPPAMQSPAPAVAAPPPRDRYAIAIDDARKRLKVGGIKLLAAARIAVPSILTTETLHTGVKAVVAIASGRRFLTNGLLCGLVWPILKIDPAVVPDSAFQKGKPKSPRRAAAWKAARLAAVVGSRLVSAAESAGLIHLTSERRSDGKKVRTVQRVTVNVPLQRAESQVDPDTQAARWRRALEQVPLTVVRPGLEAVIAGVENKEIRSQAEALLRLGDKSGKFHQSFRFTSTGRLLSCGPSVIGSSVVRPFIAFQETFPLGEYDTLELEREAAATLDWGQRSLAARTLAARFWLPLAERTGASGLIRQYDIRTCHLLLAAVLAGGAGAAEALSIAARCPGDTIAALIALQSAPVPVSRKTIKSIIRARLNGGTSYGTWEMIQEAHPSADWNAIRRTEIAIVSTLRDLFPAAMRTVDVIGKMGAAFARARIPIRFTTLSGFVVFRPTNREHRFRVRVFESGRDMTMTVPIVDRTKHDEQESARRMQAAVLQSAEACLSAAIVERLTGLGLPIIAVHDAFGVPVGTRQPLFDAFTSAVAELAVSDYLGFLADQVRHATGATIDVPCSSGSVDQRSLCGALVPA